MTLAPDRLRAETDARIRCALQKIQQAQYSLNDACALLSPIVGGIPQWKATGRMSDQVRALWYRVDALRNKARYQKVLRVRIDDTTIAALLSQEKQS